MSRRVVIAVLGLLFATISLGYSQQSASFALTESTFNAGGSPADGQTGSSASFRISQDAIGDSALGGGLTSSSFLLDGGFVHAFAPSGEVHDLIFTSETDLSWAGPSSAVAYNGYRDLLSSLSSMSYGACEQQDLSTNTWQDADVPPSASGYFYLVTGISRLDEEGTKGFSSQGAERLGIACP